MKTMTREEQQALVQQYLTALKAGTDFRDRKVRRLRAAIRTGAFENRLKLEIASDRLASDLMDGVGEVVSCPPPAPGAPHAAAERRESNERRAAADSTR
jgi:hypothetical protein